MAPQQHGQWSVPLCSCLAYQLIANPLAHREPICLLLSRLAMHDVDATFHNFLCALPLSLCALYCDLLARYAKVAAALFERNR